MKLTSEKHLPLICICLVWACLACTKTDPTPDPVPDTPKTKQWLIKGTNASDNFSWNLSDIQHDSLGRVTRFTAGGEYKAIYQGQLLHHVLSPVKTFNGEYQRSSWVFLFGADKRLQKVLQKEVASYDAGLVADNHPFFSGELRADAYWIDSMVYTPSGQVREIWRMLAQQINSVTVSEMIYTSPQDTLPEQINDYDGIYGPLSSLRKVTSAQFIYHQGIVQPASEQLWFLGFCQLQLTVIPNMPAINAYRHLVLLRRPVRQYKVTEFPVTSGSVFQSRNFVYGYTADSSQYRGIYDPDDIVYDRFTYYMEPK